MVHYVFLCFWWTMGAGPSTLYCAYIFGYIGCCALFFTICAK